MKRYLFSLLSLLLLMLLIPLSLSSCQDEDFGYSQEEIFRNAYERNFIKAFGEIDPEETWDFSSWGMHNRAPKTSETRADGDTYYYVEKNTIDWIRQYFPEGQSNTGTSFGMLVGQESFEIIPIYQSASSTVDWDLHMVLVNNVDGTDYYVDKKIWSKSERIEIPHTNSAVCPTCSGNLMIDPKTGNDPCVVCGGNGKIPVPAGTSGAYACTHEGCVNGQIMDAQCTTCSGTGKGKTCANCGGKGYYQKSNNLYDNCPVCGGTPIPNINSYTGNQKPNNINKLNKLNITLAKQGIDVKLGTGDGPCEKCDGTGKTARLCDLCNGMGFLLDCSACGGDGKGTLCTTCNGTGQSDQTEWVSITNANDTKAAEAIRSLPLSINSTTYFDNVTPSGGIIFFYLKYANSTSIDQSSLNKKMVFVDCPRPTNIPSEEIKVIGCEEGDGTTDFNDIMFIIKGKPLPVILESSDLGHTFGTMIAKRYMIEDLGSTNDWDFNDIIVDVTQQIDKKLTASSGSMVLRDTPSNVKARLKYLCGTLPIKVQVGSIAVTPQITNPVDNEQTTNQLYKPDGVTITYNTFENGTVTGWSPDYLISENVTGWTPSNNQITVNVWPDKDISGSSITNTWTVSFPERGKIPYIIATDWTEGQNWPSEGQHISEMSWWSLNPNQTSYNTGN